MFIDSPLKGYAKIGNAERKEEYGMLKIGEFSKLSHLTVKALSIFHKGPYAQIGEAYSFIMKYAEENGYKVAGLARESYIDGIWN